MTSPPEPKHPTALVARHLALPLEGLLVAASALALVFMSAGDAVIWLTTWVIVAFFYIGLAGRHLYLASRHSDRNVIHLPTSQPLRGTWSASIHVDAAIVGAASVMGVIGAAFVLRGATASDHVILSRVVAALTIIAAWILVQFGFSRLYADSWFHTDRQGGLEFPGTNLPGLVEFAYFTFSVGATFQTSDTSVTSTHMRWLVTIHAVICFLYNSVLLAFAVSLILGR